MRRVWIAAILLPILVLRGQIPDRVEVGPLPGGGVLLNSAWIVWPAGRQVPVDSFPMSGVVTPDVRYLLVLNAGQHPPSISSVDLEEGREVSRTPVPDAWLGLTFAPKSSRVYVGGGAQAAVYEFGYTGGKLQLARTFHLVEPSKRTERDFAGDVAFSPDGRLLYVAELFRNSIAVINPQSGRLIERFPTGRRPYRILFHPDGQSFFVSSWADGTVLRHMAETGALMSRLSVAAHPTDMAWVAGRPKTDPDEPASPYLARIFVTASNTNNVYVLGVTEANDVRLIGLLNLALSPRQPAGMTPSALAWDPSQARLYVACSDANTVAVADVAFEKPVALGLTPVGWYPTSVLVLPGGGLAVVNGKGTGSPLAGTVSLLSPQDLAPLEVHTRVVFENSPYDDSLLDDAGTSSGSPIPSKPGESTPIHHVIYIVKGGFTYDEVFGGYPQGKGEPALALFREEGLPHQFRLAREFVLLDNFYRNGDGSGDGLQWSFAAIASDFIQKLWPASAGGRRSWKAFDGTEPAAHPPAGYLWHNAVQAGLTVRNYGCMVREPTLRAYTAAEPPGTTDVTRSELFIRELVGYEKADLPAPRLVTICLDGGNPRDQDQALGRIAEAVTRSRIWPSTAIFVVEAGGPAGKDHVSPYRAPALVISPYARRKTVDSTLYNTASVLRTIELLLGLRPMTHYDAAARPLVASFQPQPDTTPYSAAGGTR
ncbi:MAG: beta-propeller fold lactonase family protein [Bryobacteraceae bacterium]